MSDEASKNIWGPAMWCTMHNIALGSPEKFNGTTLNYGDLFQRLFMAIPCSSCSKHALDYLAKQPINLSGREQLTEWVFRFHNEVNLRLGKKELEVKPATFINGCVPEVANALQITTMVVVSINILVLLLVAIFAIKDLISG